MKLQKKTSLLASLALSGMASLAVAQTQPATIPSFTKMRADSEKARVVDFGITLSPFPSGYSYLPWSQNVKRDQLEINAVVRREWEPAQGEQAPTFHWVGELDPLVSAYGHDIYGNSSPLFGAAQQYTWSLEKADGIVLKTPDPNASAQAQLEQAVAPSTARKQFRLDFGEGGGLEEYNKVNLQPGAWPKVTTAKVGVTGGVDSAILPAQAKINWHMPYTTDFQVNLKIQVQLPGTLTNPAGILVDLGEISQDDLMQDFDPAWTDGMVMDKLRIGTPLVFGAATVTVFRLATEGVFLGSTATASGGTSYLAPANYEVGEAFVQRATPWMNRIWQAYLNSPGAVEGATLVATVTVIKLGTHGWMDNACGTGCGGIEIGTRLRPRAIPQIPAVPQTLPETGEGTGDEGDDDEGAGNEGEQPDFPKIPGDWTPGKPWAGENPPATLPNPPTVVLPQPPPDPFFVPQPQPLPQPLRQPDGSTVQRQIKQSQYVYFYSPSATATSDYWVQAGNPQWKTGYYYTDLSPTEIARLGLTEGRVSFCLYGHPYGRPVNAYRVKVTTAELEALKASQNRFLTNNTPNPNRVNTDFDTRVSREIFRKTDPYTAGDPLSDGTTRTIVRLPIFFASGAPGAADVPPGTRAPSANRGTWYQPETTTPWPSDQPIDGIDPVTGLKRRYNSDWLPPIGSIQSKITGGKVVKYRNGYPDFSEWAEFTAELDAYTGDQTKHAMEGNESSDFTAARNQFINNRQMTIAEYETWRKTHPIHEPNGQTIPTTLSPTWVWHHNEDMIHMEFVPSHINTGGPYGGPAHDGGAQLAVNARW